MPLRRFTLDRAESLLPRLTHLLQETRELKLQHDSLQERLAALSLRMRSNGHALETQLAEARQAAAEKASALQRMIDRWQVGEPRIAWWHPLEAGAAGRRPLAMDKK